MKAENDIPRRWASLSASSACSGVNAIFLVLTAMLDILYHKCIDIVKPP